MTDSPTLRARRANHLLEALPPPELDALRPHLEPVSARAWDLIYDGGAPMQDVYFPISSVMSMLLSADDGMTVEVESVGAEGATGALHIVLGATTSRERVVCEVPGAALRLEIREFHRALCRLTGFRALVQRYARALVGSIAQNSLCNRLHSLEQRCARWLLRTQDRVQGNRFELTHEHLAFMLGVRRPTMSEAVAALQGAGMIEYGRREMTIVDRAKLESIACECYAATVKEFDDALRKPALDGVDAPGAVRRTR